jgi:uncharacterized protein with GYD domain
LLLDDLDAIYILLSNLTDESWKTIKEKSDRIKEVNKELEEFGVRVINRSAVLGPYDFAKVVEAPENRTIGEICSRGTIKIISMAAIPFDEFITSMKKHQRLKTLFFYFSLHNTSGDRQEKQVYSGSQDSHQKLRAR